MNTSDQTLPKAPVKRPYVKPEIVYQESLEAMAGVCPSPPSGKALGFCGGIQTS